MPIPERTMDVTPRPLPQTLDEAVDYLLAGMDEDGRSTLLGIHDPRELGQVHFGWGMGIRNGFGLWVSNPELCKALGDVHPDTMSTTIIRAVWLRLRHASAIPGRTNEFRTRIVAPDH